MKLFEKLIKNNGSKGSTLISVLVVTTILSLFLITLQPIMFNYTQGSVDERDLKQADFSARSANDAIVSGIIGANTTLINGLNSITSDGSSLTLNNFSFSKTDMGTVEAKILRLNINSFSVITKSTVNNQQRTIAREIIRTSVGSGTAPQALPGFFVNTVNNINYTTTSNTSLAVGSTLSQGGGGDINIGLNLILLPGVYQSLGGSSNIKVDGTIYSPNTSFTISGSANLNLRGQIYDKKSSPVTSLVGTTDSSYSAFVLTTTQTLINTYTAVPPWVVYTGNTYTAGIQLIGGQRYSATGSFTTASLNLATSVTATKPVYIVVKNNSSFSVTSPLGTAAQAPKIFFILEGNAQLTVVTGSSVAVYGNDATTMNVTNPNYNNSIIYGHVRVGQLLAASYPLMLQYTYATGGSGTIDAWSAGQYIRSTY